MDESIGSGVTPMSYLRNLSSLHPFPGDADYYDEKQIEGIGTLQEFLAGFLSHYPFWIKGLYGIRAGFVRLLGMRQPRMSLPPRLTPDDISFVPGARATIFKVKGGEEGRHWVAGADDKHLCADVIVAAEPLANGLTRFHVGTVVHYHHWTGPVYMNVIRPFHHIVVQSMMQAGIRYAPIHRAGQQG
jgi:hypothetical protein